MKHLYDDLAAYIMFSNAQPSVTAIEARGLTLRKSKTLEDMHRAVDRGLSLKQGHGKTETELAMIAVHLQSVLKPVRKPQQKEPKK